MIISYFKIILIVIAKHYFKVVVLEQKLVGLGFLKG